MDIGTNFTMSAIPKQHIRLVRTLYKRILQLHRHMPEELRHMGDQYVKEEFKRHKRVTPVQTVNFLTEWSTYAKTLSKQLAEKSTDAYGRPLRSDELDNFNEEQAEQLLRLYHTSKGEGVEEETEIVFQDDVQKDS